MKDKPGLITGLTDMAEKEHLSKSEQFLAATGMLPLFGALAQDCHFKALNYSLFVALYFLFKKLKQPQRSKLRAYLEFLFLYITSAVVSHYLNTVSPESLSFDCGLPTALAMALGWLTVLHFFRFSLPSAFILSGMLNLVLRPWQPEVNGPFLDLVAALGENFLAGGATVGVAIVALGDSLKDSPQRSPWLKYTASALIIGGMNRLALFFISAITPAIH